MTFPQIVFGERVVDGWTELRRLERTGELEAPAPKLTPRGGRVVAPRCLTSAEPGPHTEVMAVSDTIMVVEDDDATREFLADNLAADSYGVVTAASGRQAFNLLEVKDCDLLLLDVMLPDASGFELCRRLRDADGIAQRIDPSCR